MKKHDRKANSKAPAKPVSAAAELLQRAQQTLTAKRAAEQGSLFARSMKASQQGLIQAVQQLSAAGVAALLKTGINVNFQDDEGMTALHHAAALGARPCIRLLVASGRCDYLLRDNQDRYAYQLARQWARDYAVGRLLAKKQAQQAATRGVAAYELRT